MKKRFFIMVMALAACMAVSAQDIEEILLNAATHNSTRTASVSGALIFDDGTDIGPYGDSTDYWLTIIGSCDTGYAFRFQFEVLDMRLDKNGYACPDTIFVYDGPDINSPLLWYATGTYYDPYTFSVFASPSNTAQALTLRIKTAHVTNYDTLTGQGFRVYVSCAKPCENLTPYIDSIFYKTRNGEVYEFGRVKYLFDTSSHMDWDTVLLDSVLVIDTMPFYGVNLCMGDGVIFTGHCDYTYSTGWYHPTDSTTKFMWSMGTTDTISGVGKSSVYYDKYIKVSCYEVVMQVEDENGCASTLQPNVRVRIAQNPLKTLFTLSTICSRDSLFVNMGYDGDNATLTLRKISYVDVKTKTNDVRTFIPDGTNCPVQCFTAPVVFNDFPGGMSVTKAGDICSICVNYEHEFMGDYTLAILCPSYNGSGTNGKAFLKLKNAPSGGMTSIGGGGGLYTGIPYGGSGHHSWEPTSGAACCDSVNCPYGLGWNYCFSRNGDYTLCTGEPADIPNPTATAGMASQSHAVNETYNFWPVPPQFTQYAGQNCGSVTVTTLDSSDHANKSNYYYPADDFSTLVGCPLNGEWNIEICDTWGMDNGWVFSCSLDTCNVNQSDCQYQVGIDSLIWAADTSAQYCDYELGHYRGAVVSRHNDIEAYILTPDTAGTFPINVTIYDEFGCVWDTNTSITSIWTPAPDLGPDTNLCSVNFIELDASDRHDATDHYTYTWSPYGQSTAVIQTETNTGGDVRYVVNVKNENSRYHKVCETRDTIDIFMRRQPRPSFAPQPFAIEGCDPLTLTFDNQSVDGYQHYWDFGDGNYSYDESPTHTYAEGIYQLKYYIISEDECIDSLIYPDLIAVYKAPKAAFSWEPAYPSVLSPTVQFTNNTSPRDADTKYFWELQYNKKYPLSVETLTQENPVFDFSTYADPGDVAGNYTVRLIARSDNRAPSGDLVYCRDTSENTILIVNDFLQFPNVVTPNGDGINDRFVIVNLIEGMAFPINCLDVFNKWGTNVYHRENIATEVDFWDPSGVPAGTYFYRFTAKGYKGNIEHNGAVEVIK